MPPERFAVKSQKALHQPQTLRSTAASPGKKLLCSTAIPPFQRCKAYHGELPQPRLILLREIKTATRQKHIPLNSYVSLNKPIYEEESDRTLMDVITEGRSADPEELIIGQESYVSIESRIDQALSPLERKVLASYLDGKSYQEIAKNLDRHVKSIDNALQRVKHKLEKLIRERNQ